jgi:hypothetical protein
MRTIFIIIVLCAFGTVSMYAEANSLGDILQNAGQKKALVKSASKKKMAKKRSRFIFKDAYDANGIGSKDKESEKKKSESYEYANKSKFKFMINDGSPQSNMMRGQNGMISGGMASGGVSAGQGGGGGR